MPPASSTTMVLTAAKVTAPGKQRSRARPVDSSSSSRPAVSSLRIRSTEETVYPAATSARINNAVPR